MRFNKEAFITGFALFSLFFGAGNLILPPYLGFQSGNEWSMVTLGFIISAVLLPLLGIFAHARLQGTMMDFGKKISPAFSLIYCLCVYGISISLPSPRTASVTYEMAIQPFFDIPSWVASTIYFALVLLFVLNRSKIISIVGKYLTPIILVVIISIICIGIFNESIVLDYNSTELPIIEGLLEGYQTFDTIGAVVVGGVLIISLKLNKQEEFAYRKTVIRGAGVIAGLGLLTVYAGLIYIGAHFQTETGQEIDRTLLLNLISGKTLGSIGSIFLAVLVSLACFTTAVGIVTGTADFMKDLFKRSQKAYVLTAVFGALLGVLIGQFDVHYIIAIAVPALMFIYPITIVLILLNILPDKWNGKLVFQGVISVTVLFSIPDFLVSIGFTDGIKDLRDALPMGSHSLGWVVPSFVIFVLMNLVNQKT